MKIELNLPVFRAEQYEYPETGIVTDEGVCAGCGDERYGLMAKLVPFGWLHAEDEDGGVTCLQKAIDSFVTPDPAHAWLAIAKHVAKYPSRHGVSTLRSVITTLAGLAKAGGPGVAELAGRLNSAEAQLQLVDQRYGAVHEARDLWRSGDIDADDAMQRIHDALGTPAIPGRAA